MNTGLVASILEGIIRSMPVDLVKGGIDKFLDFIEDKIKGSNNQWDDAVFGPLLIALRKQLSITEEAGSKFEDKPVAKVDVNVTVKDQTK